MASLGFDIFARDHASRVFDKVGDNAERLGRRIDGAGKSGGGLSDLGRAAEGLGGHLGTLGDKLASLATSTVLMAGKTAVLVGALSTLAAGAASASGYVLALAGELAPLGGLAAALPGALLSGAAALVTWKLALVGVGEAMKGAFAGDDKAFFKAFDKLTSSAQAFALEFKGLVPQLKEFQAAAQEGFFSQLNGSLANFVNLLGGLKPAIQSLAAELGGVVRAVLDVTTSAQGIDRLNAVFASTRDLVGAVKDAMRPLLQGFLDLGAVGAQWLGSFAGNLRDVVTTFGQWMSRISGNGQALSWLNDAAAVLRQLGSLAKDLWQALVGLLNAARNAGTGALGVLGQLVAAFSQWVNSAQGQDVLITVFRSLSEVGQALTPIIVALGAGLAGLAPIVAEIAVKVGGILVTAIKALGPALAAIGPGISALIDGIGRGVAALAPALLPLGQVLGAALAGLAPLFAAIGAGLAALLPGVEVFVQALSQGLAALAPALAPVGAAIGSIAASLAPLLPIIGQLAAMIATQLAAGIQAILPSLQIAVAAFGNALLALAPIVPLALQLAAALINSLVPALAPLLPQIAALVTQLVAGLVPALLPLVPIIGQIAGIVGSNLVVVLGALVGAIAQVLPPLSQAAVIIGNALLAALQQISPYLPAIAQALVSWVPALANLLPSLARLAIALMPQFLDAVMRILPLLPDLITSGIQLTQAWLPLIPLFADLLAKLAPHIPLMIQIAAVIAERVLPTLIQFIQVAVEVADRVIGAFQRLYDTLIGHSIIPDLVNGILGWIRGLPQMFADWFGAAKDWAISKFTDLINWVRGLPGAITGALGNLGSLLGNAGHDLIVGLWNGMVGMFDWLKTSIYNFFSAIMPDWVKQALGIASPSKVFAAIGKQLPAGMALGIEKASGLVRAAVEGLAGTAAVNAQAQIGIAAGPMSVPITPQAPSLTIQFAGQPLVGRDEIYRLLIAALNEAKGRGFNLGAVGVSG